MRATKATTLLLAPEPIFGESPSSWLHRLCLMHGRGARAILKHMGVGRIGDPDIGLTPSHLHVLVRGTNVAETRVHQLGLIFQHLRGKPLQQVLHHTARHQASYAFCPLCLAGDSIPHLRIGWRFVDWQVCPQHGIQMHFRCMECESPILALRPQQDEYACNIGRCQRCAADLISQPVEQVPDEIVACVSRTQKAIVSAFLHGYCLLEGFPNPLPLEFVLWSRDTLRLEGAGNGYSTPTSHKEAAVRHARYIEALYHRLRKRGITSPEVLRTIFGHGDGIAKPNLGVGCHESKAHQRLCNDVCPESATRRGEGRA